MEVSFLFFLKTMNTNRYLSVSIVFLLLHLPLEKFRHPLLLVSFGLISLRRRLSNLLNTLQNFRLS